MTTRILFSIAALLALLLFALDAAAQSQKGKGRAPCESLKTFATCDARSDCTWVDVSQGKGKGKGSTSKCRTLKATPR